MTHQAQSRLSVQPDCAHWGNVLLGLSEGDLRPLAAHLNAEPGKIDICVARRLIAMIERQNVKPAFALRIVPSSMNTTTKETPGSRYRVWALRLRVISFIEDASSTQRGAMKQTVFQAAQKFGISQGAVRRLWASRARPTK